MTTRQHVKGAKWERDIVGYLKRCGFRARRLYGAGRQHDEGDIGGMAGIVIEAKDQARFTLATWLGEAHREAENAREPFGVVVAKRARRPVGTAYVVMSLRTFVQLYDMVDSATLQLLRQRHSEFLA